MQVHVYASHATPLRPYAASHKTHLAPLLVCAGSVAGDPLVHVHVYARCEGENFPFFARYYTRRRKLKIG